MLYVGVIVYSGAIGMLIPGTASKFMILTGLYTLITIALDPRLFALTKRCSPLFLMWGMAMVSALWAPDWNQTIRQAMQLLFALLLGIIIFGKLGPVGSIKFLVRAMGLICILSAFWAIVFPLEGVHQADEMYQSVHAGLWRGVLAHKVTLGAFAGLTFGLHLFYGWRAYRTPYGYFVAMGCSVACLFGTSSATGVATGFATAGILFLSFLIVRSPPDQKKKLARILAGIVLSLFVFMYSGAMNQMANYLGKSSDLSGRAEYWDAIISVVNNGSFLIGYGYATGFPALSPALEAISGIRLLEAHNGIMELLVAFGYPGVSVVIFMHLLIFANTIRLLRFSLPKHAATAVFPLSMLIIYFLVSYAESVMLNSVGIWTILLGTITVGSLPPAYSPIRRPAPSPQGSVNDRLIRNF